jgi:DNA-binding cell septation regulator SpoVG
VVEVSDIERCEGDIIASFSLRIGGILIRQCSLRQGRGSVYLNFPSRKDEQGRWIHLVEVITPTLENFLQDIIHKAVAEVVR